MRGKRCARRYVQTLPCTLPNSDHIYRRNCREHFQWSHLYCTCAVRCGGLAPHLRLVAFFLLTPKVMQITRLPQRPKPRPPRNDANVRRNCNIYVHAIYHLASALCACCMHDLFRRSRLLVHQPREGGRPALSSSGEPRDLRISSLPQPHIQNILTLRHGIYHCDELISRCSGGLMPDHRTCKTPRG